MTHHPDPAIDGAGYSTLSVASILSESATRSPHRAALHFAGTTISYGELWAQTREYAGALRDRGIGRGDRVAIILPNVPDFARVYYAVLALGAVVVPVHLLFKAEEIEYVLRDSGADLVVVVASMLGEALPAATAAGVPVVTVLAPDDTAGPRLEDEALISEPIVRQAAVGPLDAATILYTSGTTGTPKGSVGSHLAIVEQVNNTLIDALDIRRDDVLFGALPLFHTFGQSAVLNTAFRSGASIILLPRFDPAEAIRLMVEHEATIFEGVPTMYIGLIEAARSAEVLPALKFAVSGGAPLPVAVLEAFAERFGAEVHEGYGLTETSSTVSVNSRFEPTRPGTVGRTLWGVEVGIAEPEIEGRIAFIEEPDSLGEVIVRGYNVFKGYLGRPEASDEAVVDGWLRTGDLGTLSSDGIITIVDRKKDLIVRNGYNVYPTEVEAVMMRHPSIAMAAVFGVTHEVHGQEVHAVVVPSDEDDFDVELISAYTREHVAAYKYPRVIHVAASLPLGPSGKVLKRALAEQYSTASAEQPTKTPRS